MFWSRFLWLCGTNNVSSCITDVWAKTTTDNKVERRPLFWLVVLRVWRGNGKQQISCRNEGQTPKRAKAGKNRAEWKWAAFKPLGNSCFFYNNKSKCTWPLNSYFRAYQTLTLFENYSKCHIWIFLILAFSTNFCPIKTDLSGNTVWPQASGFQKLT